MTSRKSVALTAAVEAVENVSQYLRVPRLVSIRSRILALAVLGTVIPAGIALGVAYSQNRRARQDKITQELVSEASQTAGALGVWLKERVYDLRVFAGSDEVSNNLAHVSARAPASARLREYLRSLHERFSDFDQLLVLDPAGKMLASSAQGSSVRLPADWQKVLRQQSQLVGHPYWDTTARKGKLLIVVPVNGSDGGLIGAFAAELTLTPVQAQLRAFVSDTNATLYLTGNDGAIIASSRGIATNLLGTPYPAKSYQRLKSRNNRTVSYESISGVDVVGTLKHVPQVSWVIISEMSSRAAFTEVRQFRNIALIVVLLLLVIVAGSAYWLGVFIVRPLERLARGAAEVALGDFSVDLPNPGGGEVGVLTGVFNSMVKRLREGREELERLSITDGLTGLTNHRELMQRLHEEESRSSRSKRPFSILMCDVDHFKAYNDAFGHPAGDEVLKRVAGLLKESTRAIDCVARYGGEEFAIMLPETAGDGAMEVAERIRSRVDQEPFPQRSVTISIGLAEFPSHGDRADKVIAVADAALYEAKHAGRNRVARAKKPARRTATPAAVGATEAVLPLAKRSIRTAKKKS